jgi:hypothetical protein
MPPLLTPSEEVVTVRISERIKAVLAILMTSARLRLGGLRAQEFAPTAQRRLVSTGEVAGGPALRHHSLRINVIYCCMSSFLFEV